MRLAKDCLVDGLNVYGLILLVLCQRYHPSLVLLIHSRYSLTLRHTQSIRPNCHVSLIVGRRLKIDAITDTSVAVRRPEQSFNYLFRREDSFNWFLLLLLECPRNQNPHLLFLPRRTETPAGRPLRLPFPLHPAIQMRVDPLLDIDSTHDLLLCIGDG